MTDKMYPNDELRTDKNKYSVQSRLFGHRIKPQQTRYEYLVEFLQVAIAKKRIMDVTGENEITDYFPVSKDIENHAIEYMPVSNMGLKRFIFFNNSRLDTKSDIDKKAYQLCLETIGSSLDKDNSLESEKYIIYILQNILYGFSIENAGRSWFNKNLLPICPEVIFPESLARKDYRKNNIDLHSQEVDSSFDFNSYTYMARGGEVYYLHLLHAVNNGGLEYKERLEKQIGKMLDSMPEISEISRFIQNEWQKGLDVSDSNTPVVKKKCGAIPVEYGYRDEYTLSEVTTFMDNHIQPMEKINLFSCGIVLQIFRLMTTTAAKGSNTAGSAWVMDVCDKNKKEYAEVKKLSSRCFLMNEECIIKYIDMGIEYHCTKPQDREKIPKIREDAEKDTTKVIRKLGKSMGIIIPLSGANMRFTLSEDVIKFLVMSLIPAGSKVTFDRFLDLIYEHFEIVVSPEHYERAVSENKAVYQKNVTFLQTNKIDFAQKLKNCGLLRDLSDATAIVENPYEREEYEN